METVAAANDPAAIANLAARGAVFTCGPASAPLFLDEAVLNDRPDVVEALLVARADPNARWFSHGDRFPLEEAIIEARTLLIIRTSWIY